MLDGPRALKPHELPSLSRLVDTTFMRGKQGEMSRLFPWLFAESNFENLLVFTDQEEVVSHVGMTLHWACLAGCTVGVACIGAVATYEAYRGRGLATQLMDLACKRAAAWGADIMMISGGRGLYRRMGAADVGLDCAASADINAARNLSMGGFSVSNFTPSDLAACANLYRGKIAYYIRPRDEWEMFASSRVCMCLDADFFVARKNGATCGYLVAAHDKQRDVLRILEFGGDAVGIAAVLPILMDRYGVPTAHLHLQAGDFALTTLLRDAGAALTPSTASGTLLLLDFGRLMSRLHPFFEAQVGREAAASLRFREAEGRYVFVADGVEYAAEGKMQAAEWIFGNHERPAPEGALRGLFPAPSLWYGLNYV